MDKNEKETGAWRIKKEISLGDMIAFAMAFISVVYAYSTLDKRLAIIEERALAQEKVDNRQDVDLQRSLLEIKESVRELNRKMDSIARK